MSELIIEVTEQPVTVSAINELVIVDVTEQPVAIEIGNTGPQGATGATGAQGQTGATGSSGVVSVNSPITNSGTASAAVLGFDQTAQNTINDARYVSVLSQNILWGNISGMYVKPINIASNNVSTGNGALKLRFQPIFTQIILSEISIQTVAIAGSAGSVMRFGVYNVNASGTPTTLVRDFGTVDTTTTGQKVITGLNLTLTPGLYAFGSVAQGSPVTAPTVRQELNTLGLNGYSSVGYSSIYGQGWQVTGITGALPSSLTNVANSDNLFKLNWKWA